MMRIRGRIDGIRERHGTYQWDPRATWELSEREIPIAKSMRPLTCPSDSTATNELPARSTTPTSTTFVQNYFILVSSITFYSLSPLINHTNASVYLVTPWLLYFEIGPTSPSCERSFNPSLGWGILGGFYIMIQNWCVGHYIYLFRLLIPLPMIPTATHPSSMNGTRRRCSPRSSPPPLTSLPTSPHSPPHLTPHLTSLPTSPHSPSHFTPTQARQGIATPLAH